MTATRASGRLQGELGHESFYPYEWDKASRCFTEVKPNFDFSSQFSKTYSVHLNTKVTKKDTACDWLFQNVTMKNMPPLELAVLVFSARDEFDRRETMRNISYKGRAKAPIYFMVILVFMYYLLHFYFLC